MKRTCLHEKQQVYKEILIAINALFLTRSRDYMIATFIFQILHLYLKNWAGLKMYLTREGRPFIFA